MILPGWLDDAVDAGLDYYDRHHRACDMAFGAVTVILVVLLFW